MLENRSFNRTKIIATIGPSCSDEPTLRSLIQEGVDVFRVNFSHGDHATHLAVIDILRKLNAELKGNAIAVLGDLQGPKIRIGEVEGNSVDLVPGAKVIFTTEKCMGTKDRMYLSYTNFPKDVQAGEKVLMDDGKIQLEVVSSDNEKEVELVVKYGGPISSRKGVNLPNTNISMPVLTEKDLVDLEFIIEQDLDWVALSFVRNASDIVDLRARLDAKGADIRIIAKIEKPQAVEDIEEIFKVTDGVMVARGDLGVEVPIEYLPMVQKRINTLGKLYAKPVIVATQLMESMITSFMPTRAEVMDVANAVLEGADCVMLSGETSVGKHPLKVVESMVKIITSMELESEVYHRPQRPQEEEELFYSDSMCYIAVQTSKHVKAEGLIAMTQSGYTAIKISSYRPQAPIFVFTSNRKLLSQMNLYWGCRAYYYDKFRSTDETIYDVKEFLKEKNLVKKGEIIINTASMPLHEKKRTNMIKLTIVD